MPTTFSPTLGGLKTFAREILSEYGHEGLAANVFGFEAVCLHETNVTARRCRCLWGVETFDLTANQPVVSLSRVFDIQTGLVHDGTRWLPMKPATEETLDRWDDRRFAEATRMLVGWRNLPAVDAPRTYLLRDANTVELVPAPLTTRAASVQFRGWSEPGVLWATAGDAAEYPLAERYLPLTAHQVAITLATNAGLDPTRIQAREMALMMTLLAPGALENAQFSRIPNFTRGDSDNGTST